MSVVEILPTPIIQMGFVEKIVEVAQNQPQVQLQVAQEEAKKNLKIASEQVAMAEEAGPGHKIRDKGEEEGRKQEQTRDGKRQARDDSAAGEEEAGATTGSPWSGNIVDITI